MSPPTVLPAILGALGVTAEADLAAWRAALERVRPTPGPTPADARAPYQGMGSFQPEDAEWFFGREDLIESLQSELHRHRIVAVVGPSGAGKSSLLRAGLLPKLDNARLVTPTAEPLAQLVGLLTEPMLATTGATADVVPSHLIVDQFEELFTTCRDEGERRMFVAQLGQLVTQGVRVAFGLRADFYGEALRHPLLARTLQRNQVLVGPMSAEQLRRAIIEPANKAKARIDDGLVELLQRDLAGVDGIAYDAGALPLLSHALLTTWESGDRRRMTVEGYSESGGIHGAVSQTAETIFTTLNSLHREQARVLFLRMVRIGEDNADTRRRVPWSALAADTDLDAVLYRFVDARLVTADTDTVEIAHDALLHSWPRLRHWINADRALRLVGQQVGDAADAWEREGRDDGALYRGSRLSAAQDWLGTVAAAEVDSSRRAFVEASTTRDRADQHAARRKTRHLQQLLAGLSAVVVIAAMLAVYAFVQRGEAITQRDMAISRQVAIEADKLKSKDIALARQLSLIAYQISPTPEARSSLLSSYPAPTVTRALGAAGVMQAVAVTRDRRIMATAGEDGTIQLWSLARPGTPTRLGVPLTGHTATVFALAFTPDGRTLASGAGDHRVQLWDLSDLERVQPAGSLDDAASTVYSLAYSPDGATLVGGTAEGKVIVWPTSGGASPLVVGMPTAGTVQTVAFSPDGTRFAAAGKAGVAQLWDMDGTPHGAPLTGPAKTVFGLAFSPDGRKLAGGSADKTVWVWTLDGTVPAVPLKGPTSFVNGVSFSPDGATLAGAASDGHLWLWNTADGRATAQLPHPAPVTSVHFLDNSLIATSCSDGAARIWDVPGPRVGGSPSTIHGAAFGSGHHELAVVGLDNTARLWDVGDPRHPVALGPTMSDITQAPNRATGASALSPDLRTLAVGDNRGNVVLWDVADPARPTPMPTKLTGPTDEVESVVFSPNGKVLAVTSNDSTVTLWDVSVPDRPSRLGSPLTGFSNYAYTASFSPDGRLLAVGSADQTARVWDVADPSAPRPYGPPLRGHSSYVYAVAFSRDGRILATAGADSKVQLWNVEDPTRITAFGPPLTGPTSQIFAVAFTADNRTLAASSGDGSTWLWDVDRPRSPRLFAVLTGPPDAMYYSDVDVTGAILATAGADADVWLWDTDPQRVAQQTCSGVGTPITRDEWKTYVPDRRYRPPCSADDNASDEPASEDRPSRAEVSPLAAPQVPDGGLADPRSEPEAQIPVEPQPNSREAGQRTLGQATRRQTQLTLTRGRRSVLRAATPPGCVLCRAAPLCRRR